jgi:hypothetical protein
LFFYHQYLPFTFFALLLLLFLFSRAVPVLATSRKAACLLGLFCGGAMLFPLLFNIKAGPFNYSILVFPACLALAGLLFLALKKRGCPGQVTAGGVFCLLLAFYTAYTNPKNYMSNRTKPWYNALIAHNTALFDFKNENRVDLRDITVFHTGDEVLNNFANSFWRFAGIKSAWNWGDKYAWNSSLELILAGEAATAPQGDYSLVFGYSGDDKTRAEGILTSAGYECSLVFAGEAALGAGSDHDTVYMWLFKTGGAKNGTVNDVLRHPVLLSRVDDYAELNVSSHEEDLYSVRWFLYRCGRKARKILGLAPPEPFRGGAAAPLETVDGHTRYSTVSADDRLATDWIAAGEGVTRIALQIQCGEFFDSPLYVQLQDNGKIINTTRNLPGGSWVKAVSLPAGTKAFRLLIQPGKKAALTLPDGISVYGDTAAPANGGLE